MCKVIDADCVLANMFAYGGMDQVTIRDLNLFRERVESRVDNVFVDVCGDTICMAVDQRPDMFSWGDESVRRVTGAEPRLFTQEYVDSYFNWRIPEDCRGVFVTVCQQSAQA